MAQAGQTLFLHEWKAGDPLSPGGDGLGPVFNAASCVACHRQGGTGGAGGLEHNVTTFTITEMSRFQDRETRDGVVHAQAVREDMRETLKQVHRELPAVTRPTLAMLVSLPGIEKNRIPFPSGVHVSQRNTPALFGANLIDAIPDRVLIANERKQQLKWGLASSKSEDLPVGRALRLADGRSRTLRLEGPERQPVGLRAGRLRQRTGLEQSGTGPAAPSRQAVLSGDGTRPDCRTVRSDHVLRRFAGSADRTPAGRQICPQPGDHW